MRRVWWLVVVVGLAVVCGSGCEDRQWTDAAIQREIERNLREAEAPLPEKPAAKLRWDWDKLAFVQAPSGGATAWHPPLKAAKNYAPAPTVKRGPDRKVKGKIMATYIVSGAGDSSYDGIYIESGTYNGQPAYTNGSRWLWYANDPEQVWVLSESTGALYTTWAYHTGLSGETPVAAAPWYASTGTTPAPTVAEVGTAPPEGFAWNEWDGDAPFVPDAPYPRACRATLGGTDYIVFPVQKSSGIPAYGFFLFNLSNALWQYLSTGSAILDGYDSFGTAAVFDCGDGTNVHLCSGVYTDELGDHYCDWTKFALVPLVGATRGTTATLALASNNISNFVRVAAETYRFMHIDGATITLREYTTGTSSTVVATYATGTDFPTGYSALPITDSDTTGRDDQHLFMVGTDLHWMRRCSNAPTLPTTYRVAPFVVNALGCTALTDVLTETLTTGAGVESGQTWAEWNDANEMWGDLGGGPTPFGDTSLRWVPGSNSTEHQSIARKDTMQRHYLSGDSAILTGWYDNHLGDMIPFVVVMTGDVVDVPVASMQTTAYLPASVVDIDAIIEVEGTGGGSGDVTLHITQPVHIEVEGTGGGSGEVTVIGATHVVPDEGTGGGSGAVTLISAAYPEGPGGYIEAKLTPNVWPGAAPRVAMPSHYSRMNNRRYGGALPNQRPQWWVGIDEGNPLAQYAAFWSWINAAPSSYVGSDLPEPATGVNEIVTVQPARVITDATKHKNDALALFVEDDAAAISVVSDVPGYSQTYYPTGFRSGTYVSEDGQFSLEDMANGWTLGVYSVPRVVDREGIAVLYFDYNYSNLDYQVGRNPWTGEWKSSVVGVSPPVVTRTKNSSPWNGGGLNYRSWISRELPTNWAYDPNIFLDSPHIITSCSLAAPLTLIWDWQSPWYGHAILREFLFHSGYDVPGQLYIILASDLSGNRSIEILNSDPVEGPADTIAVFSGGTLSSESQTHRLILSIEENGLGSMYYNGGLVASGVDCHPDWWPQPEVTPFAKTPYCEIFGTGRIDVNPKFDGIVREFGYLSGYAATATDVATNPMFTTRYGLRGAPTLLTDRV